MARRDRPRALLRRGPAAHRGARRSGTAASASGARSRAACWARAFFCRANGLQLRSVADAVAPGLLLAQAIGRLGNYFNQELFGKPTDLPWGLEIDVAHRPSGYEQFATFHPTFLYEALWNLAALAVLLLLDRRLRLGFGRVFALYVMLYTLGRGWIEDLRIDPVELRDVGGRALQRVDLDRAVRARCGLLRRGRTPSSGAAES